LDDDAIKKLTTYRGQGCLVSETMKTYNLRLAASAILFGWLTLLSTDFAMTGIVSLVSHDWTWGELGFPATFVVIDVLNLSVGYGLSIIILFIPLQYIELRRSKLKTARKQALVGAIVFGFAVPIFNEVSFDCFIGGGSFSSLLKEMSALWSVSGAVWPLSAMIAGAVTFALAARANSRKPKA
jgi:hypothetical protein